MKAKTDIHLPCSACGDLHHYVFSEETYNAIEPQWRLPQQEELLAERPGVGEQYWLRLFPPLYLDSTEPFWVVYLNPSTSLGGIATEQDMKDLRFCKCQVHKVVAAQQGWAIVNAEVLECLALEALPLPHEPDIYWLSLLDGEDTFKYRATDNYASYSHIEINIQSNLGLHVVVKKEAAGSRILAVNQWGFHLNEWFLCHIPLSAAQERQYGIHRDEWF